MTTTNEKKKLRKMQTRCSTIRERKMLFECTVHGIDERCHTFDRRGWCNAMTQIRNVPILSKFPYHRQCQFFQFVLFVSETLNFNQLIESRKYKRTQEFYL